MAPFTGHGRDGGNLPPPLDLPDTIIETLFDELAEPPTNLPRHFRPPFPSCVDTSCAETNFAALANSRGHHHVLGPPSPEPYDPAVLQLSQVTADELRVAAQQSMPSISGAHDPFGTSILQGLAVATGKPIAVWTVLAGRYAEQKGDTDPTFSIYYPPSHHTDPQKIIDEHEPIMLLKSICPAEGNVYQALIAPDHSPPGQKRAQYRDEITQNSKADASPAAMSSTVPRTRRHKLRKSFRTLPPARIVDDKWAKDPPTSERLVGNAIHHS
jgi:hypothetical protein